MAVHAPLPGGCLCGGIRYTITFPSSSSYPPSRLTCQCTQCRKSTGSLLLNLLTISPSQVQWGSHSTFREFQSSSKGYRGFCGDCGSTITWRSTDTPAEIEIFTGTLDGDVDALLCEPEEQWFCGNAVRGVTEPVEGGIRWERGKREGRVWKG